METKLMDQLERQLLSTNFKKEEFSFPFILTEQEEKIVLENKLAGIKKHAAWRMWDKGLSENEIDKRLLEVDWDAMIDKPKLLEEANQRKHFSIQEKEMVRNELEKERLRAEELRKMCDAKYMFNLMAKTSLYEFGKKLIVNEDTSPLIRIACFFLSNDERFETEEGLSFKKGLWIRGISGLGKTYLFSCLRNNLLKPISIYSMVDISREIKYFGKYDFDYSKMIYIDDVGTESAFVKNFGTDINFFKEFIESYYMDLKDFNRLIVSTNNSFKEIEDKYGSRVKSRLKDMFNIVDVTGKDLRG